MTFLGRVLKAGDHFRSEVDMDRRRIEKVLVKSPRFGASAVD